MAVYQTRYFTNPGNRPRGMRRILFKALNAAPSDDRGLQSAIDVFLRRHSDHDPLERRGLERLLLDEASDAPGEVDARWALLERTLRRMAREHPLLLILDDMHLAQPRTLEWMNHIVLGLKLNPAPIVILALRTTDAQAEHPALARGTRILCSSHPGVVRRISLGPLAPEEIQELLLWTRSKGMDSEEVVRRSNGNPAFALSLASWRNEGATGDLPEDLASLMRAKLHMALDGVQDRFTALNLLRAVAVFSGQVPLDLLFSLMDARHGYEQDRTERQVDALVDSGLLLDTTETDGTETLRLSHPLVGDLLCSGLSPKEAKKLHRLAAEELLSQSPDPNAEALSAIARHLQQAGDHQRSRELQLQAAERAKQHGNHDAAARLYETLASDQTHEHPETFLLSAGAMHRVRGAYDEAERCYRTAIHIGMQRVRAEARIALARIGMRLGRLAEADALLRLAQDELNNRDNPPLDLWVAQEELSRQRGEASRCVTLNQAILSREPAAVEAVSAWLNLAWAQGRLGQGDEVAHCLNKALALARDNNLVAWMPRILRYQDMRDGDTVHPEERMQRLDESIRLAETTGQRTQLTSGLLQRSRVARALGLEGLGEDDAERAYQQARETRDASNLVFACKNLGAVRLMLDDAGAAAHWFQEGVNTCRESGFLGVEPTLLFFLASAQIGQEQPNLASGSLHRILASQHPPLLDHDLESCYQWGMARTEDSSIRESLDEIMERARRPATSTEGRP